jgi:NADH-quinone oxidoreductase subunit G
MKRVPSQTQTRWLYGIIVLALMLGCANSETPNNGGRTNWLSPCTRDAGAQLPFDSLAQLRAAMIAVVPHLGTIDGVPENAWTPVAGGDMSGDDFGAAIRNHYLTNPIARASEVMAELTRLADSRTQPLAAE